MLQVLIVDDEKAIRNGLQVLLDWKSIGFEIAGVAENGLEAQLLINQKNIDVVIADVRMPKMSGLELARQLMEHGNNVDVIIISGYQDFEYARCAIEYGVRNYLLKPLDSTQLTDTLLKIKANRNFIHGKDFEDSNSNIIHYIKQYLEEHISEEVSLNQLAQLMNYNPVYLGRLFKKETGESFRDYLNLCRVKKAAKLLHERRYKIHEVSELVGYKDLNYFCSVFKEIYGVPPSEYKHKL